MEQATEYNDADFLDPDKFQAMLEGADGEEGEVVEEAIEEDVAEAVEEEIEEVEEEEAAEEVEEIEEEVETPEAKSVKHFKDQAKVEAERAAIAEHKYNELVKAIEARMSGEKPSEEATEFEPLDEAADQKYGKEFEKLNKQQQELIQQQQHIAFQNALGTAHAEARAKYEDFDTAFDHYKGAEEAKFKALGYPAEQAKLRAQQVSMKMAHGAWQSGQDLGELFYSFAKAAGYNPAAKPKPKGLNMDALEKNKKRTEKKATDTVNPTGHSDLIKRMNDMAKLGSGVSDKDFAELLKQATS